MAGIQIAKQDHERNSSTEWVLIFDQYCRRYDSGREGSRLVVEYFSEEHSLIEDMLKYGFSNDEIGQMFASVWSRVSRDEQAQTGLHH